MPRRASLCRRLPVVVAAPLGRRTVSFSQANGARPRMRRLYDAGISSVCVMGRTRSTTRKKVPCRGQRAVIRPRVPECSPSVLVSPFGHGQSSSIPMGSMDRRNNPCSQGLPLLAVVPPVLPEKPLRFVTQAQLDNSSGPRPRKRTYADVGDSSDSAVAGDSEADASGYVTVGVFSKEQSSEATSVPRVGLPLIDCTSEEESSEEKKADERHALRDSSQRTSIEAQLPFLPHVFEEETSGEDESKGGQIITVYDTSDDEVEIIVKKPDVIEIISSSEEEVPEAMGRRCVAVAGADDSDASSSASSNSERRCIYLAWDSEGVVEWKYWIGCWSDSSSSSTR